MPLPAELGELAFRLDAEDPDAAFRLRQAARLGQALTAGDALEVNRCFIDRGGEPPTYDAAEYAFESFAGEEPLRLLSYCTVRLRWEELTDENGGFTQEQLAVLAADLGLEGVTFSEELMLGDGYTQKDGRWYPPGRDGYGPGGPEQESRFAALRREGDAITATLRFYRDAQCLSPAYDLVYTFGVSPAGRWLPLRCERVDAAA